MIFDPLKDCYVYHNTKVKEYPGYYKLTVCTKAIFKDINFEQINKKANVKVSKPQKKGNEVRLDSIKRAKERVFDIAILNDFKYFVTWTLDKEKIDRYNPGDVSKKLKKYLNNMQQRNNLSYLIIPEHHKDGAIHMHGLINGDIKLVDSGKKTKDNKVIYNMPDWKYGYSTAIELTGDTDNVAKYITKYISKDFRKIFGNFYYCGGVAKRQPHIELIDLDYHSVETKEYKVPDVNIGFKYFEIPKD